MTAKRRYWLVKSEPDVYSIDDLAKEGSAYWDGVRNFKARNYMKEMKRGDGVLFYHSNANPRGVVGLARVAREAYPDFTQFDKKSKYYEPRATKDKPYWYMVDIEFVAKLDRPVTLDEMRAMPELEGMPLLKRGQRLSVQPVAPEHWRAILARAGARFPGE